MAGFYGRNQWIYINLFTIFIFRRNKYKNIVVCLQFPSNYPESCILIELKSKTLSVKLLDGLALICESEAKKILGKPQVLPILKFIRGFIDDNPLSCCYDEIASIKKNLSISADELKLKQKTSTINLNLFQDSYFLKAKIFIPDEYPGERVSVEVDSNLPLLFQRWLSGQSKEMARQCVEPPIFKKGKGPKKTAEPFQPKPSLEPIITFFVGQIRQLPKENCQLCKEACLPSDPRYINPIGGKKCPACQQQIFHDKWRVGESLAEKRWAHHEARQRELEEVADFLQ
ncbi:hypothetical protein J437_LFUL014286 [Ladona fulva]|uniref:RWD domain-containing protein n=1 Tax=Ladona fulva TaxID=123851 RepID=A0A8K0KNW8_LADFU|nr:hypothetical protein J437_LFUL014286 [Ladona fulva]